MHKYPYINNTQVKFLEKYTMDDVYIETELYYKKILNGIVFPNEAHYNTWTIKGGVLESNGSYVESSVFSLDPDAIKEIETKKITLQCSVNKDQIVIYVGQLYHVFGHAITDNLSKVWFLFTPIGKELLKNGAKIVYTIIENREEPAYFNELFNLIGIAKENRIQIKEPTQFTTIYIPDSSLFTQEKGGFQYKCYTNEFKQTIDIVKENALSKPINLEPLTKIYLTRTRLRQFKRDFNETEVESFFKSKGYDVISPEKFSIQQQIFLLNSAKTVAVTEGSISLLTMFCQPRTSVQLLLKCNWINDYQICVNHMTNINYEYITIHKSHKCDKIQPYLGPFFMYKSPQLLRWSGHNNIFSLFWIKKSFWDYINPYWWRVIKKYIIKNESV